MKGLEEMKKRSGSILEWILIEKMKEASRLLGHTLTEQEEEQLWKLTYNDLIKESQLITAAVNVWQATITAAEMERLVEKQRLLEQEPEKKEYYS
ncbi:hypothetical protein [Hungatella effluvii]|uniref:hypothetical protein n=1 Tax=Hungatella effluvii TaxID=1096246 RepID=UPI0022E00888|nr:hypothetical protein [Hungatella effluvii]